MKLNPDFEQNYNSRTSQGTWKICYDSFRLVKWLAFYDRSYYKNVSFFWSNGDVLTKWNIWTVIMLR